QREERGRNSDARDDTKNQSQRFNREMFGNVRPWHKSAVIDSKLSRKRKLSFWGPHAPRVLPGSLAPQSFLTRRLRTRKLRHEYQKRDLVSDHNPCDVHVHGGNRISNAARSRQARA